jgi:hypothetical protein
MIWVRPAAYLLFSVVAALQSVPSGAADDTFLERCLPTIGAGDDIAKLCRACLANNIDATILGAEEREAAYIAIDPGMSKAEIKEYGKWFEELQPDKQAELVAVQNFATGLISTCLFSAGAGNVKPDGSIID